jgi:hypothetical protein
LLNDFHGFLQAESTHRAPVALVRANIIAPPLWRKVDPETTLPDFRGLKRKRPG